MIATLVDLDRWVRVISVPRRGAPALFLDRDGTIIHNHPYLADPEQVVPIAGASAMLADFRRQGHAIIVVSNQSGVARGLVDPERYDAVTERMLELIGRECVDAILACPFHPEGQPPFRANHEWRKPRPGMIIYAAERFGLDLGRSTMVGDGLADIKAGMAAGVGRVAHVRTGHGNAERAAVTHHLDAMRGEGARPSVELLESIAELRVVTVDR